MAPAISARGLSKTFGRVAALRRVDLEIETGERVAIFGANGAGKSTLLRILSTLSTPTSGTLVVNGIDALRHPDRIRAITGVVAHHTFLYDELTVVENLRFYGRLYGVASLDNRIAEALRSVQLKGRDDDRLGILSRGQQQRVAIARALLPRPSILLLDEPDTGLDQEGIAVLERLLVETPEQTVLFSSHNREWAAATANRSLVLHGGRTVALNPGLGQAGAAPDLPGLSEQPSDLHQRGSFGAAVEDRV